jgi:hypothetical protein
MADFSKQYYENFDFDWYDFDYEEIFNELENGYYAGQICEGLGTWGVYKSDSGEMLLGTGHPENMTFKSLEEIMEELKKDL